MNLVDVVSEWLKDQRVLSKHISIDPSDDGGFYIDLNCEESESYAVAYVGKSIYSSWLHDLNPADPDFFPKLRKFIIELHNRLAANGSVECSVEL
jgi:hypothetical protein